MSGEVPKDAESIVAEILDALQDAMRHGNLTAKEWQEINSESMGDLHECCDRVVSLLRELPHKWCKVNPFELVHNTPDSYLDHGVVEFVSPNTGLTGAQTVVPYEVAQVILVAKELRDPPLDWNALTVIRNLLTRLLAQVRLRDYVDNTNTEEFFPSAVSVDGPGEKSSADGIGPKLTNDGRTISYGAQSFTFTKDQAPVIRLLFQNFLEGNEYVSEQTVWEEVGQSERTFANAFKSKRAEFSAVVERKPGSRDLYRLRQVPKD